MHKALLATALMLFIACNKVSYVNPTIPRGGAVHSTTGHFFIFGLVGTKNIAAYEMCPNGVAHIKSRASFLDLVLGTITLGLYVPRSYNIECGRS